MKNLAIIFVAAIFGALAVTRQPALPPAINRSGVAANHREPVRIANPSDVGARQGVTLPGWLLSVTGQKGTIMPQQKTVVVPLHVVQEIETTIRSAKQAIGAISALSERLMTVAPGEQNEYAFSIDWGLRTLANTAACKLHDDLENLKATIQGRKLA